ncbi:hypothetical protein AYO38_06975 [bacterium SCGC AG-212-C10]|nr:hypothetical protein AYO38_06975 [bacterium SCGC AG-212-C10]
MATLTIEVAPEVLERLRASARESGREPAEVAAEIVVEALNRQGAPTPAPWKWHAASGALIDLDDWSAVKAFLEQEDNDRDLGR